MKNLKLNRIAAITLTFAIFLISSLLVNSTAFAQQGKYPIEVSMLGGVQGLLENGTAMQDDFINIPVALSIGYRATSVFAVEGEFAWLIPVENSVEIGATQTAQDLKSPDILTYQANLRVNFPVATSTIETYATAGLGAMTFLSTTDANRFPQLSRAETAFAINFGVGASLPLASTLSIRADLREFAAFPSNDAVGLSNDGDADPIWMPRATVGFRYHF